jgi:hypothetical protein
VGFNPDRKHRRSNWDYVFVAAALLAAAGVLVWAVLG